MVIAVLLSQRGERRSTLAWAMLAAMSIAVMLAGESIARGIAAAAQVTAQGLLIVVLYDRITGGRHPLTDSVAYAWLMFAVLVAPIPIGLLAGGVLALLPGNQVPGYTVLAWWVASASSGAALAPVLLAPSKPAPTRRRLLLSVEFVAICALYAVVLLHSFLFLNVFTGPVLPVDALPPAVATLPFLAWASLRFGVRGFAIVAAMLITAVITSTLLEVGPFLSFPAEELERSKRAWIYIACMVGPAMIFPVGLAERAAAEERARGAHA